MNEPLPEQRSGPLAEHVLAYVELTVAALQAQRRSMQCRLMLVALAGTGVAVAVLLVTAGIVGAAWSGEHRWAVLLATAAVYLALAVGCLVALRRLAVTPSPVELLLMEIHKDAELFGAAIRGESQ